MDRNCFTKSERKELRMLAGLAYERELGKALKELEENFRQWRERKITVFELSDIIHKFHNEIARDLWNYYETGDVDLIVRHAIIEGIISKSEINPSILGKLR